MKTKTKKESNISLKEKDHYFEYLLKTNQSKNLKSYISYLRLYNEKTY